MRYDTVSTYDTLNFSLFRNYFPIASLRSLQELEINKVFSWRIKSSNERLIGLHQ
jgi:hypothetical protein